MKTASNFLRTATTGLFFLLVTIVPFFFLPWTMDFIQYNKIMVFVGFTLVSTIFWGVYSILTKTIRITVSPILTTTLLFIVAILVSLFFATPYPYEVFFGTKTLLTLAFGAFLLFGISLVRMRSPKPLVVTIISTGVVSSVLFFLQVLGIGPSKLITLLQPGFDITHNATFSLAGSIFASALFLVPVGVMAITEQLLSKTTIEKVLYSIASAVIAAAVLVNIYFMLPGKVGAAVFIPFQASWSIVMDILKTSKLAFLGVGPESYAVAFAQFRPVALNMSPTAWTLTFSAGRTEPLTVLTTLGLFGFVTWTLFIIATLRLVLAQKAKEELRSLSLCIIILLVELFIFPSTVMTLLTLYIALIGYLAILRSQKDRQVHDISLQLFAVEKITATVQEPVQKTTPSLPSIIFAYVLSALVLIGTGFAGYGLGRIYAAEYLFTSSLLSAAKLDGLKAYNLQQQAIAQNPFSDTYHRAFASTNFLIANALISKKEPTDEDKNNASTLLEQSIREAKIAAQLDPRKTTNWQSLASLYQQLIQTVKDMDQWTVAALVRAIQTAPTDPTLRFSLATLYYGFGNYEQAVRIFQQTIELKPDWANAYYNLSAAYQKKNEFESALQALYAAKQYIPANSEDALKLETEIGTLEKIVTDLAKKRQAQEAQQAKTTTSSSKVPEGQIRLPQDLGIPAATPPVAVPEQ